MDPAYTAAAVLAAIPDVVFIIDSNGTLRYVNDAARAVLGWEPAEWTGRNVVDLVHPDDMAVVLSSLVAVQGKELGSPIEVRVRTDDESWRLLEIIGRDKLASADVEGVLCVARDLTRRRMWEVAGDDVACFQQVLQHAASITVLLQPDGTVRSINGAFGRLLRHDPSSVVGRPLAAFAAAGSETTLQDALNACRMTGRATSVEVLMRVDGTDDVFRPIRFELVSLIDDPVVAGIVATGHDISELQAARMALEAQVRSDRLTGLANRQALVEKLDELLAGEEPFAVLFVDLDRFKPVNDLLGHEAGDQLLVSVSSRLRDAVRSTDLISRVGGDEFVVVAPGIADELAAAAMVRMLESSLTEMFVLRSGQVHIGASVGVAMRRPGATAAGLLADADVAMYDTKNARRGRQRRPLAERRRTAEERRRIADEPELGLQLGEVTAYLQPIVAVATGRPMAVEALARWDHPQRGLLSPASFLELAEVTGLDLALGDAVLDSACATLKRAGRPADDIDLSINLSNGQLSDPHLAARMKQTLARHGIPIKRLVIELTERSTMVGEPLPGRVSPDATIRELHALGASLAVDDFGTGRSSLTWLRSYPLKILKIDGSFISGLFDSSQDQVVIAALIGLANALDLVVVSEGTESQEQLEALADMGCHAAQGFHIAGPMPPQELLGWLQQATQQRTAERPAVTSDDREAAPSSGAAPPTCRLLPPANAPCREPR